MAREVTSGRGAAVDIQSLINCHRRGHSYTVRGGVIAVHSIGSARGLGP